MYIMCIYIYIYICIIVIYDTYMCIYIYIYIHTVALKTRSRIFLIWLKVNLSRLCLQGIRQEFCLRGSWHGNFWHGHTKHDIHTTT